MFKSVEIKSKIVCCSTGETDCRNLGRVGGAGAWFVEAAAETNQMSASYPERLEPFL